ncbi:hypothetical protein C2I36_11805 [Rhodobacteraceae bacterium WD3A24]|nr:hypothetical protein C2I36_11805 [Rhodobacteraceae bacterium WD3A24]
MTPEQIEALFTGTDGAYRFARWGRPIAPVVFGVDEATLAAFKGAIEAVVALAGHRMAETDPELGANLMIFVFRDWEELNGLPDLDRMIPDFAALRAGLRARDANQYRLFRFDEAGAIRAAFVFLRIDAALAELPAAALALDQAARVMLLWGEDAFAGAGPLARGPAGEILREDVAALIRAAYDPRMPPAADDAAHALRLAARLPGEG